MIDYWKLTRDFSQGDVVQKIDVIDGDLSPYVGRVTAVLRGIGCLDVQWPFGNERVFPDDVVKVNPKFLRYLPPSLDQTYMTIEIEKARKVGSASPWRKDLPPKVYVDLARYWHGKVGEVVAYDNLYRTLAPNVDDGALREEVGKFYSFARNAGIMLVQQVAESQSFTNRSAAYWVAQNRTYRATSDDISLGKPSCPKCAKAMRRATYKMHEGAKVKLFACPKCLFLLDPVSILGPSGEPHTWF